MFDFNTVTEFSQTHCIAICALLVPTNLLATLQTMIFRGLGRPDIQVRLVAGAASSYALMMIFHVLLWLAVGVVMAPTYVLLLLGSTCLVINFWAIAYPASMKRLLRDLVFIVTSKLNDKRSFKF